MSHHIAKSQIASPHGVFAEGKKVKNVPESVLAVWEKDGLIEKSSGKSKEPEQQELGEADYEEQDVEDDEDDFAPPVTGKGKKGK